ncbi:hypothetical protein DQ237_07800 [Blastococcus sp. TF02-8]|uniref:hypothetical protein n=1 Tax=Blastococcus sp. TF02-8 TaxID=2250574 RepID=UPI000DE90205|nr:hypothetical protein [Blastococcus sp. TF02-8]RBY96530.1 hypothetical protein DQ237_07800 [Blastococcus sp. TF02-8]
MTTPTGTIAAVVRQDVTRLRSAALDAAVTSLERRGGFFPLGLSVDSAGRLEYHLTGSAAARLSPMAAIEVVERSLLATRDELRAVALVMDITWLGSDAVRVDLEHRDCEGQLRIRTPYSLGRRLFGRTVTLGESDESHAEPRIWP